MSTDVMPSVGPSKGPRIATAFLIFAATFIVYWPALHGGWSWDDTLDITGNRLLRTSAGLWKIWFDPAGLYDYYPLKYTVQWIQWHLWQANPTGYHVTNIVLHATSSLLVWRILRRLGVKHAWIGGLVFAVHPLAVESVAWIHELKNTLSLPLFLASFDRYLASADGSRRRDYGCAVLLFIAAMLCKTSVVAFPAFLLIYGWWKHGRISARQFTLTVPFFLVSLALGALTLWFQQHVAIAATTEFRPIGGALARMACAGSSAVFYLSKILLPIGLVPIYPQWPVDPAPPWIWLTWPLLIGMAVWFWSRRESWGRHAVLGFAWFLLFAAPVLGFVPISSQRFSWVLDHLAYVPMLGIVGLGTAFLGALIERLPPPRRWFGTIAVAVIAALLATGSFRHAGHFASDEAVWTYTTQQNPRAWIAFFNLGKIQQESKRHDAALRSYEAALRTHPVYPDAYYNVGNLLRDLGRPDEAIAAYRQAISQDPRLALAHGNLAELLSRRGHREEAITECERALAIAPDYTDGQYNLGSLLLQSGRAADALPHFVRTLQLDPSHPGAENNYAIALASLGRLPDAIVHYERAAAAAPRDAAVHNNWGAALRGLGRNREAVREFQQATALKPDYVNAWYNLGACYGAAGDYGQAVEALRRVVALAPSHVEARLGLAAALQASGHEREAFEEYATARRLRPSLPPIGR